MCRLLGVAIHANHEAWVRVSQQIPGLYMHKAVSINPNVRRRTHRAVHLKSAV